MPWKCIDTKKRSAAENMALDVALLSDLKSEKDPILHFYDWEKDALTYGHFIDPYQFLNRKGVIYEGIDLARRPTGGGIIFHNCDLAFSVLIPSSHPSFSLNTLENYAFVNRRVVLAVQQMLSLPATFLSEEPKPVFEQCKNFCMAKPTKYDVMIEGKKVAGAAQRRTRHGYLHQGSISIGFLPEDYLHKLLDAKVIEGMRAHSFSLLGQSWSNKELLEARQTLRLLLQKALADDENT